MPSSRPISWNLAENKSRPPCEPLWLAISLKSPKNDHTMSKAKKELRAAKKAAREERQAKRIINWIVGGLLVFFLIILVGYLLMYA